MTIHPLISTLMAVSATIALRPKTWLVASGYFYVFIHVAVLLKRFLYQIIGCIYGLEPLSASDDFYLYDHQINPINVPSFVVFPKSDRNPEEFLDSMLQKLGRDHRCSVKFVKIFGKYFFKKLSDEEYKHWKETKTGVKYDIKTEQEAIDFALSLKKQNGRIPSVVFLVN